MISTGYIEMGSDPCGRTDAWLIWSYRPGQTTIVNRGWGGSKYDLTLTGSFPSLDQFASATGVMGMEVPVGDCSLTAVSTFYVTGDDPITGDNSTDSGITGTLFYSDGANEWYLNNNAESGFFPGGNPPDGFYGHHQFRAYGGPTSDDLLGEVWSGYSQPGVLASRVAHPAGQNYQLLHIPRAGDGSIASSILNGGPFPIETTVTSSSNVGVGVGNAYASVMNQCIGRVSGMAIYNGPIKPGDYEYWSAFDW